jgi:hypothetical protein
MPEIQCALLRGLQLVLQLSEVRLAIRRALLPPLELVELRLHVGLEPDDALLHLGDLEPAILHLALDLATQAYRFLAHLDLCLAPPRLHLALDVGEELPACVLGGTHP